MKKTLTLNVPSEERLAEMLQRCLDAILLEGMAVDQAIELTAPWQHLIRPQVEAALLLHAMQAQFDPRPGLLAASKKRVLERIVQEPPKQSWLTRVGWQQAFVRFAAVLTIVMLLFVGLGSGIRQVQASTPEQAAYRTKLALEEIQLMLAFGDAAQVVNWRLEYAQQRLDEVDYLIATKLDAYIPPTMANYQLQVIQAAHVIQTLPPEQFDLRQQLDRKLVGQLTQNEQYLRAVVSNVPQSTTIVVQQSLQIVQQTLQTIDVDAPTTPRADATATNTSPTPTLPSSASATVTSPVATPTIFSTSTQPVVMASLTPPTWLPTATFTTTATLQPTPTVTETNATVVPTPPSEVKPSKTPKPNPTRKPPPSERPTKEPPPQKPTKEK